MRVEDFLKRLEAFKLKLNQTRDTETLILARDARAMIVRRIQNERQDFAGQSFGGYSAVDVPAFFMRGRSLNAGNELKVREFGKKNGGVMSYKDLRTLNNLQVESVDMTFTGRMWRETIAELQTVSSTKAVATIAGRTERARKLLGYNSKRYGNVLRLSKKERAILNAGNRERVVKLLREFF